MLIHLLFDSSTEIWNKLLILSLVILKLIISLGELHLVFYFSDSFSQPNLIKSLHLSLLQVGLVNHDEAVPIAKSEHTESKDQELMFSNNLS